ncbi:MAG: VWA domain-containing protein [Acidobacteriota bacterium]
MFRKPAMHKIFLALWILIILFAPQQPAELEVLAQNKKSTATKTEPQPPQASPEPQDESVQLRSDLVVVNVTVINEAGKYAHGLKVKDFQLSEDKTLQTINSFDAEEAPFAAAILVDMSGSMGYKFSLVRAAAASFVEKIGEDDQVAVFGFNNQVKLMQEFSNVRDITEYIWDAEAKETTKLYDCLNEALGALAERPERRRAILLISDGYDTSSQKASLDSVMKKALQLGVNIYCVDLIDGSEINTSARNSLELLRGRNEMKQFAEQSGAQYINSPNGDNLETAFANIIEELRNQYTLTYYSTNDKRDGKWRTIQVALLNAKFSVRARRGYYAAKK